MSTDPTGEWTHVFGIPTEQLTEAGTSRWVTPAPPAPPPGTPVCATHCAGAHHYDGEVTCVSCGGVAYRLKAHQWIHMEGHYFYSLEAVNGAPAEMPKHPTCTRCGGTKLMTRR